MSGEVYERTTRLCRSRPDVAPELMRLVEHEQANPSQGWAWDDLDPPISPQLAHRLHVDGILRRLDTKKKLYAIRDRWAVVEALGSLYSEEFPKISAEFFSDVIGFGDLKELFAGALNSGRRVNFLLCGPPASAKTLFLLCLERLPRTRYFVGSRTTKAGLAELLVAERPRLCLIDEVDKVNPRDYAVLLSVCETGRVVKHVKGEHIDEELDTTFFACANDKDRLPPELLSRFEEIDFVSYTRDEFLDICAAILENREDKAADVALYVAERVWDDLGSRDVREAVRIARLSDTLGDVDRTVETLRRYRYYV